MFMGKLSTNGIQLGVVLTVIDKLDCQPTIPPSSNILDVYLEVI